MTTTRNTKRKDKARVVLRKGESQRKDGKYDFRWTSPDGKRHSIYAPTLEELREKEKGLQLDSLEGIKAEARYVTLNDVFTLWAKDHYFPSPPPYMTLSQLSQEVYPLKDLSYHLQGRQ